MATQQSNLTESKSKRTLKIGDASLWLMLRTTTFFKDVFFNIDKAAWDSFSFYSKFNIGLLGFFQTTLLRSNRGKLQGGLVPVFSSFFLLVTVNSTHIHYLFSGFGIFITPYHLLTASSWIELYEFLVIDIHSEILLCFEFLFLGVGFYQSLQLYIKGGNESMSSRGVSWFWQLLFFLSKPSKKGQKRTFTPDHFWCEFLFETLTMVLLGLASLYLLHDTTFAIICFVATVCEGFQTLDDNAIKTRNEELLHA